MNGSDGMFVGYFCCDDDCILCGRGSRVKGVRVGLHFIISIYVTIWHDFNSLFNRLNFRNRFRICSAQQVSTYKHDSYSCTSSDCFDCSSESFRKKSHKVISMDDIRNYYGSTEVQTGHRVLLQQA